MRPEFSTASRKTLPSRMVRVRGFSPNTSLPALTHAIPTMACQWSGSAVITTSTSALASMSRKSAYTGMSIPKSLRALRRPLVSLLSYQ